MNTDSTSPKTTTSASDRELTLTRLIEAPRERVFQACTDPELMKQWFAPRPYTTPVVQIDVRPGGAMNIVMRGPDGAEIPCPGVYLDVVPNERLVTTDAFVRAWEPSEKPFITVIWTFEAVGASRTKYTARVLHWSVADREAHEKMGFHQGWTQCAEQLAALVEAS